MAVVTIRMKFKNRAGFGWRTTMTSLRYEGRITSSRILAATIYYTNLNNFDYQYCKYKREDTSGYTRNVTSAKLSEVGAKIRMQQNLHSNNLTYGVETSVRNYMPNHIYRKENGHKIAYNDGRLKLYSFSAYAHNEMKVKNWLIEFGLRASVYKSGRKTKSAIEPRIKVNTYLNEKNKAMLAYDRMVQPVHTVNEMRYTVRNDFWVPFQENNLAGAHQLSIGWKNYTTQNFSFSVEPYYKRMNNLLLIKNLENYLDFGQDYQVGKGTSLGLEVMGEYTQNRFTAWLSYSLSKSTRTFNSKTYAFKYDAPHDVSASVSYVVVKKAKRTNTLSANMQFKSGYPYLISEISYPSAGVPGAGSGNTWFQDVSVDYFGDRPNVRLKPFFRIDINYTIEKKRKRGSSILQLSLLNATGNTNVYNVYKKENKYKALTLIPFLPSISFTRKF